MNICVRVDKCYIYVHAYAYACICAVHRGKCVLQYSIVHVLAGFGSTSLVAPPLPVTVRLKVTAYETVLDGLVLCGSTALPACAHEHVHVYKELAINCGVDHEIGRDMIMRMSNYFRRSISHNTYACAS